MRRLASVFVASSRRADKSDVPSPPEDGASPSRLARKKSRVFPSLSRKHLSSIDPLSLVPSDLANSSSSSSSGSTLRTPDDDGLPRTPSKKGSWKSWLVGKNTAASDLPEGPPWQSSKDALRPPQSGANEADDASSQSDDPYGSPDDTLAPSYSPQQMATARANARALIMSSLVPEPTAPPLFLPPDAISFPRSCHSYLRLRRRETLESKLHKRSLLARLERPSSSIELSIAPFASKPIPANRQMQQNFQDDAFPSADSVSLRSSGLEKWVSRSCFEDRLQVWTRSDSGEIIRTRVPGSHFGVAALEFSESLELLAGTLQENYEDMQLEVDSASEFTLPPLSLNLDPPATPREELGSEPLTLPSELPQPVQLSLSPRLSNTPLALHVPPPAHPPNGTMTSGPTVTSNPAPKRGVRFADDDGKDDQIPLGYVLRIRKNKEQKARFLRQERERRERVARLSIENRQASAPPQERRSSGFTAPRQRPVRPLISLNESSKTRESPTVSHVIREEERLRLEAEKVEMEKLRRSREMARRQAEERERNFTQELQATRARREAFRAGRPLESASLSARVPDRSASRDSMHASLRRSSQSQKLTPELVFSPVSPFEGSFSSSVPATPGSQRSFSRPPSLYSAHTTSSEDVRGRDGKLASRRMSVVSDPSKGMLLHPPYDPRVSFNPYGWTNVPQVPLVPPVPPMPAVPMVNGVPFYGMDQPLLPPTAPFMINQFGSSTSLPRNYSSEGVNSSSRNSSPHSSGSHQRRSSDDAARMNTLGDRRSGTYADVRGGKSARVAPSQSSPQRSSWLSPEQSRAKKSSSLRPVSGAYSSGSPVYMRRRTAAS